MMHEVRAKELGDGEYPLSVADVRDHLVLEEGRELGRALGPADPLDGLEQGLEECVERGLGRPAGLPLPRGIKTDRILRPEVT
jgi:hypothetical protein